MSDTSVRKKGMKVSPSSVLAQVFLCVAAVAVLFPLIWVFLTSLKSNKDFYANVWGLPQEWVWENYARAWQRGNIGGTAINSVIVTLGSLLVGITASSTTAYVLARFRFRGRKLLRGVYLAAIMVPSIIALIPQYFILIELKLIDNLLGLILVYGLSSVPFASFILFGFFQGLPGELEEAAYMDGAGYIRTFFKIMLPLAQPGIVTVVVISFIDYWNEYFKAITYLSTPAKFTMPVGLVVFSQQSQFRIDWGALMASNIILIVPTAVVYILFRRSIQTGLTAGALKG